ncbi:MAG: protein phosphatase 2C domain-containing protein [Taibaiella sp.]|nr:protein phosphatase 2C domain-containing protein [Taibaiella sp.]
MMWKAIGNSVIGTSHLARGATCEDAIQFRVLPDSHGGDVLICCVSDGAGSATHAAYAAQYCTKYAVEALDALVARQAVIAESDIYEIVENIYEHLAGEAKANETELNEYSCTLLGCCITGSKAVFFQIGDGAIVRIDSSGFYSPVWWPDNGEYQNSTSFLVDDMAFSNLNISIIEDSINEVAIFTDGLQMLALNMEPRQAHQPFFTGMFKYLRLADDVDKVSILQRKAAEYLDSTTINSRTDDDKTLFLATRLQQ